MPEGAEEGTEAQPVAGAAAIPGGRVFVSHASQDAAIANSLVEAFERAGIPCWIAPRDVVAGEFYADAIVHAIDAARALVLVLSRSSAASHHILREVERASSKRRSVIALRIDRASMPAGLEYFLNTSQWLDAAEADPSRAFPKLIEAVRRVLAGTTSPVADPSAKSAPSGPTPVRNRVIVGIAALTIVIVAFLAIDRIWSSWRAESTHPAAIAAVAPVTPPTVTAPAAFRPPPHSIAVLPFTNMSGDPAQDYFSDGVTEELINALSHIDALQVIARTSSFSFKGQNADIGTIARKLNVSAILEGSIRRSGNTIRITAQLINAVSGFHIWSQNYDRDLKNILQLQTEIATSVAGQLRVRLLGNEAGKIEVGGTENPDAYDAFLRGMQLAEAAGGDEAAHRASLAAFDQAIALDPNYGAAYGRRAVALMDIRSTSDDSTIREDLRSKARAAAERAVLLAPARADAHTALWWVRAVGYFDFMGAAEEVQRALFLAPGSEKAQQALALQSSWAGHHDLAIEAQRQAVRLDPQNYEARDVLVGVLLDARRFDEALVAAQEAKAINPNAKNNRPSFAASYLGLGQLDLARRTCEQPPPLHGCLALIYHTLGNLKAAEAELGQLKALSGDSAAFRYALIYAQWGDTAKALQWLNTAAKLYDPGLTSLKTSWLLDPIRNEPEFKALLARMNFPP
jgi:TolB-like protein/tetratricopeptide (TPR) repeat protein